MLERLKKVDKYQGSEREKLVRDLKVRYLDVLWRDPLLPKELLPDDWIGEEVRKLIKKLA